MGIQCRVCGFTIHTSGEGFKYEAGDINFCPNCGNNYMKHGVDANRIIKAGAESSNYKFWIMMVYGVTPTLLAMLLTAVLAWTGWINLNPRDGQMKLLLVLGLPLMYLMLVVLVANLKGDKKFKQLAGF